MLVNYSYIAFVYIVHLDRCLGCILSPQDNYNAFVSAVINTGWSNRSDESLANIENMAFKRSSKKVQRKLNGDNINNNRASSGCNQPRGQRTSEGKNLLCIVNADKKINCHIVETLNCNK